MSKFITGKELEEAVYDIIWDANRDLMIVSPYIKLGKYFKELFNKHLTNPKLHITLIFGKNEDSVDKSLNKADLDYFLQFKNISIVYVPKLHAKYYANDKMGVVTSINLYDYSFKNNIEFGVLYEPKGLGVLGKNPDTEVWDNCIDIAEENEVIFVKRPVYEKSFLSKNYRDSKVLVDRISELYNGATLTKGKYKLGDFEEELDAATEYAERPTREEVEKPSRITYNTTMPAAQKSFEPGYCIRTGEKIPFNTKSPFSKQAYQIWCKYKDEKFAEKFCHFSGEPSNGETSFSRPIMRKNWKKAQSI